MSEVVCANPHLWLGFKRESSELDWSRCSPSSAPITTQRKEPVIGWPYLLLLSPPWRPLDTAVAQPDYSNVEHEVSFHLPELLLCCCKVAASRSVAVNYIFNVQLRIIPFQIRNLLKQKQRKRVVAKLGLNSIGSSCLTLTFCPKSRERAWLCGGQHWWLRSGCQGRHLI